MQIPHRRWWLIGAGLVLAFVGWLAYLIRDSGESRNSVISEVLAKSSRESAAGAAAVQKHGTNMLPQLVQMVSAKDSFLRAALDDVFRKLHLGRLSIRSAADDRSFAIGGFQSLGEEAHLAVPALANLLTNQSTTADASLCLAAIGRPGLPVLVRELTNANPLVRAHAAMAIGAVEPKSDASIPVLIGALGDRSPSVRGRAAWSLGKIRSGPALSLPPLLQLLRDSDNGVRRQAMRAIAEFGPDAKSATDELMLLTNDPDEDVRLVAGMALRKLRGETPHGSVP